MSEQHAAKQVKRAYVGIYREDVDEQSALVIPEAAFEAMTRHNALASAARAADSWGELFEKFDRKEVEKVLSAVIGDVQDCAASADDLPPIEALARSGMWACAFQPLDDSWCILHDLPDQVRRLARFGDISVMTDYSPCHWKPDDLPAVRKMLEAEGWEVVDTDFHPTWP